MAIIALQAPPKRKQPFLAMVPVQVGIAVMAIIAWQDGDEQASAFYYISSSTPHLQAWDCMISSVSLDTQCSIALDIVFLIDVTSGMGPLIDACARAIPAVFHEKGSIHLGGIKHECDWRMRIVGFRNRDLDGGDWLEANRFARDADEVNAQLVSLDAFGGGDQPQSLLDAMYQIAQWPSAEKGASATTDGWRSHSDAHRVVAVLTDSDCKKTFTSNDGSKGAIDDLIGLCQAARINGLLVAPESPTYADLMAMSGWDWEPAEGEPSKRGRHISIQRPEQFMQILHNTIRIAIQAAHVEVPFDHKCSWSRITEEGVKMVQEALDVKKGVPDIVFLLDATGSMAECIDAVTRNISTFIDTLNTPDSNGGVLIKDWRIRVVGYRDRDTDGAQWLIDNPFSTDVGEVKSQLTALKAAGGGDEPESLLDAMYQISQWASAEKGASPSNLGWRHRHDAARIVVIFTDASAKNTFTASDGSGGTVDDLIQAYHAAKLKVILFAPDAPVYVDLSSMGGLEWEQIGSLDANPRQALVDYTSDSNNFRKVMVALAKTVSASAAVPTAA